MFRGTTPTLIFKYKFDLSALNVEAIYITFTQNDQTILEKKLDEVDIKKSTISVNLSQEETLLFKANDIIFIQTRLKIDGHAYASTVIRTNMQDILKEGVI